MRALGALLGAALLFITAPAFATPVVRRALVIAHNASDDPSLPPLRFADDDGVLWAETLQRLGVETTLLVDADEPTRQTHRPVLAGVRPPTSAELTHAVARLKAAHRADREAGRETDVLVIYVGHGSTDEAGHAYFTLADGRLDRFSFYSQVVDRLEADYVHVIVDACRASGVVGRRGQSETEVLEELRGVLSREQLEARPQVGFLFAESEDGETLEWSRIRAGVFSHVTRSGLMGGADINGDGMVEYSELGAFISASLHGVKGLPARLSVHASPPSSAPRRPLVGPFPRGPTLTLPAHFEPLRISVEDDEGFRLADLRRAKGQRVELRLPEREVYWVRSPTAEARLELSQLARGVPQMEPRELQERGPAEEALRRGLFSVPLDRPFYEQYVSATGQSRVDFPESTAPRVLPFRPEPPSPVRAGWEFGLSVLREPVLGGVATGPSVAWRSPPSPHYYGLRASYALTPQANQGARIHQATLQALTGVQSMGPVGLFLEAAAGWALVGVTYPGGSQGDPFALTGHAALGVTVRTPFGQLRAGGIAGVERLRIDDKGQWEPSYGAELSWRH
ncbi:caspase family protein [Hyalangium versicolor]|uniref:caspase family protein n=1 Tax=Hyalangium versicolor TaxID=2861190 RepID=UPI001CCDAB08|nr:caspase family protein [Hyalangium versicolor]